MFILNYKSYLKHIIFLVKKGGGGGPPPPPPPYCDKISFSMVVVQKPWKLGQTPPPR